MPPSPQRAAYFGPDRERLQWTLVQVALEGSRGLATLANG